MNEETSPPTSRWQQLYSSKSSNNHHTLASHNLPYPEIDQYDGDDESVTAWIENIQLDDDTEPESHYKIDTGSDININTIHGNEYSIEDKEADRILNYMEHLLRDNNDDHINYGENNNDDDDLIESIIESQKHQDAILQYRREKKIRSILQEWRRVTEAQSSKRQFLFSVISDLRNHHLICNTFQLWKELMIQKRLIVEEFMGQQKRQRTFRVFCGWINQMWVEVQTRKSFQKDLLKRKVLRMWKDIVISNFKEKEQDAIIHHKQYITRKWLGQCRKQSRLINEVKVQQAKLMLKKKEEQEFEHNCKVARLAHLLDKEHSSDSSDKKK